MGTTSIRVDVETHAEIKRLSETIGTSVGETVALAVRRLRQERMGREMNRPLEPWEQAWLDADLG